MEAPRRLILRLEVQPGVRLADVLRGYADLLDALRDETDPLTFLRDDDEE